MPREIISSFDSFVKKFPELKKLEKNTERVEGLKKYFKKGGVISAVSVEGKWPKLLYRNHLKKSIIDGDYRKDVKSVKMPVNMVSEPKYRPMIEAFLNDFDYRK